MKTKKELISTVAEAAAVSKKTATAVIDALSDKAVETLAAEGEVFLPGIGKISTRARAARQVRNPSTGEKLDKPADRALKMTFAKAAKDAINA